jgi:hypothetical protein
LMYTVFCFVGNDQKRDMIFVLMSCHSRGRRARRSGHLEIL